MKQLVLPILALFLFTIACKKEKQDIIPDKSGELHNDTSHHDTSIRLTDMYWRSAEYYQQTPADTILTDSLDHHRHFEYDKYGYVSKITQTDKRIVHEILENRFQNALKEITYSRDTSHRCSSVLTEYKEDSKLVNYHNYDYTFDANNHLVSARNAGTSDVVATYKWFDGRMTYVTYVDTNTITYELKYNEYGEGDSDNVTSIRTTSLVYYSATYDDHPNFVNTVKGIDDKFAVWGVHPQAYSKNNMISDAVIRSNGSGGTYQRFYVPEYNERGYVQKLNGVTFVYNK